MVCMRKILMVFILLFTLSGCEDEVQEPCTTGSESENSLCVDFKSLSFLGHDIVYDLGFYEDGESEIDWMGVMYQYPEFYNQLLPFAEAGYVSFDVVESELQPGSTTSMTVHYNDGMNIEQNKLLFIDVRDSRTVLKENGEPVTIVKGGFTYTIDGITFKIDTHVEDMYIFYQTATEQYKEQFRKYHITPSLVGGHEISDELYVKVEKIDIGLKVFITRTVLEVEEELEVYYILQNDHIVEPDYLVEPIVSEGIFERLDTKSDLTYDVTDFYIDTATQNMFITLTVSSINSVVFEEIVELEKSGDSYEIPADLLDYSIGFYRQGQERLSLILFNDHHYIYYSIIPR